MLDTDALITPCLIGNIVWWRAAIKYDKTDCSRGASTSPRLCKIRNPVAEHGEEEFDGNMLPEITLLELQLLLLRAPPVSSQGVLREKVAFP